MRPARAAVLIFVVFLGLVFCSCLPRAAPETLPGYAAKADPFETYRLPNGLFVIIAPIKGLEVAAVQVWVNAGSIYEKPEEQGITHLIEHMIFKGTKKRKVGEVAAEIEGAGGSINAYTTFDHTVYHVTIKSDAAERAVEVLADAVFNSTFDPGELAREKEVVAEEIRHALDSPGRRLSYALFENAYGNNPYGRRILGFYKTVKGITREMILEYIGRWYVPGNMCVVVAGDVDVSRAKGWVKTHFGAYPGRSSPRFSMPRHPGRNKPLGIQLSENVKQARVAVAYPLPELAHKDIPALDVLAMILGEGESSRLYSGLYHELGWVYSISATAFTPKGPGLFFITANLSPAKIEPAYLAILEVIKRVQETGVSLSELNQAKLVLTTDFLKSRETAQGEADILGYFQVLWGDAAKREAYLKSIKGVSAQDVQRVALRYLDPLRQTLVIQADRKTPKGLAAALAKKSEAYAPHPTVPGSFKRAGTVTKTTLTNRVTVLVKEEHRLPMVSFTLALKGGLLAEDGRVEGISNILALMLTQGTARMSAQEFAKKVEEMAGELSGFSGRNSFGLEGSFLSENFETGLELAADALLRPGFRDGELSKVKSVVLSQIRTEQERPARFTLRNLYQALYKEHPYGLKILGRKESVTRIDRARLRGFHRSLVKPENLILSVVGDVDPKKVAGLASRLFGGMKARGPVRTYQGPEPARPKEPLARHIFKKGHQTHIALGFLGAKVSEKDRYPLKVLTHVLAGQGGRLFRVLRDEMSLAYVITSFSFEGLQKGAVVFYLACAPEKKGIALGALREQIELVKKSVSKEEVDRAKNYILGSYLKNNQEFSERAQTIALNDLYGLGSDYQKRYIRSISRVSPDEVVRAAQKYLALEHSATVFVGPKE